MAIISTPDATDRSTAVTLLTAIDTRLRAVAGYSPNASTLQLLAPTAPAHPKLSELVRAFNASVPANATHLDFPANGSEAALCLSVNRLKAAVNVAYTS